MDRREADRVVIKPVRDRRQLDHVYQLVHDAYLESGYIAPQRGGRLIYCPHLDLVPETTVLMAEADGDLVGTCTLTLDGPTGFHLDDEYPGAADAIRHEARSLASSWRWASKAPAPDRTAVFLGFIRAIQQLLCANAIETCLFTLVPHFEPAYRRLLNARRVASAPLRDACASEMLSMFRCRTVLMRWDVDRCPHRWFSELADSTEGRTYGGPI
jgi:hypothetical protein